ncbi:MAG TPA: cupin domain-containing protein [Terriglobales bacterium]|nr:cupin domain-containing protein [Terriglobales bacterium]
MNKFLIVVMLTACLAVAQSADKKQDAAKPTAKMAMKGKDMQKSAMSGHEFQSANELQWGPAPAGLPEGAQVAVLAGDPGNPGRFTIRLKSPAGAKIMPHWHPADESVTLISGDFSVGMGDKMDEAGAHKMSAGDFVSLKARQHHYAIANTETVVQIESTGPFKITYVNPNDDPRNAKK